VSTTVQGSSLLMPEEQPNIYHPLDGDNGSVNEGDNTNNNNNEVEQAQELPPLINTSFVQTMLLPMTMENDSLYPFPEVGILLL